MNRNVLAGALATVLVVSLGACSPKKEAAPQPGPPRVTVAKPVVHPLVEWDRYTGRLRAVEEVVVQARVSGHLESIHFREGSLVKAGDLLFVIDERPFVADLERARASVAEARAGLAQSEAQLTQARAEQSEAEAQRTLATSRLGRAKQAVATNAISKEEVDVRESEVLQAEAGLEAAKARIASAEAAIATSKAAIATAQAAVQTADINLGYCRIRAPISGRIDRREVTVGNLVEGGSLAATRLTTIVSIDPIHCEIYASEQEFLKYIRLDREGKRASSREVRNPVFGALVDERGYPHRGHMDFVANRIDEDTGSIRGRAIFSNADGVLTPGLFMTVQLPGSPHYDAILIPDEAVAIDQSTKYVYVVGEGNVAERRAVELGPLSHGLRIVRSGVTASDRVIVLGTQRVRPGAAVDPVETEVELGDSEDGLPDDYKPVPREEWLTADPTPAPEERK